MLHYLHLFVRPKVENPWLLDGTKLTTLARCMTKVVMFASREIEFESQHVCAWFCFVPLHHWCISTVWHLVLLSLCKALNFITTSSCRNNILVLRIEKRRKKEEHNTWTFSYVHFYMHISRKLYVNFCMCLCLLLLSMTPFLCNLVFSCEVSGSVLCANICVLLFSYFSLTFHLYWEIWMLPSRYNLCSL